MDVSRYPLFDYPPYDLALATRMAEVSRTLCSRSSARALCDSAFGERIVGPADAGRQATADSKLPFVTTLHGTDITLVGLDRSYLPITRFSIEQSDGVTAISQYLRERTLREFDVKNNIQVIYNFVNCDLYCSRSRSRAAAGRSMRPTANAFWCIFPIFAR